MPVGQVPHSRGSCSHRAEKDDAYERHGTEDDARSRSGSYRYKIAAMLASHEATCSPFPKAVSRIAGRTKVTKAMVASSAANSP